MTIDVTPASPTSGAPGQPAPARDVPLPWIVTPLVESATLSKIAGCRILLKLENVQPSGSFKSRGIGNLVRKAILASPPGAPLHFYCSSGGNAGLACVKAATSLGYRSTIVVPLSCKPMVIDKIVASGQGLATVVQEGKSWYEADQHLRGLMKDDSDGVYVPPFDHPDVWEGAESLVREVEEQMERLPGAIVASVGGGGLMIGLCQGLAKAQGQAEAEAGVSSIERPQVVGVETIGADSLNAAIKANEHVSLPAITSIATSLGCSRVASEAFRWAQQDHVRSIVVSDREAVEACLRFADDERVLVEPACGATLAVVYAGKLRAALEGGAGKWARLSDDEWSKKEVVLVVCGGSIVSLKMLQGYRDEYGIA